MAELLVELFSEEIPARMQLPAKQQLSDLAKKELEHRQLTFQSVSTFVTPRRLTLHIDGLETSSTASTVEKRGPRIDAPAQAVEGFARSLNTTIDQLEKRDTPKGQFYFFSQEHANASITETLPDVIQHIFSSISWPKSMRWGNYDMRWVRPIHNFLCIFDGKTLPMTFGHLKSTNVTFGHRFLSDKKPITIHNLHDYKDKLREHFVLLDTDERKYVIDKDANLKASEKELPFETDENLLNEVIGLVEYPHVILGSIDKRFMSLPKEVLTTSMRTHQKYFTLKNARGELAPYFITVANITPENKDDAFIIAGNERVLRARLQDASFFYQQDSLIPLKEHAKKLQHVTFHAKLGTLADKAARISELATYLSVWIPNANLTQVERAGELCKADLVTGMVGEFPELQGTMGRYYASEHHEDPAVAQAIDDHYHPLGPDDGCPDKPVSIAIALADKIDTMTGLFGIGEKPTGSKDPFALRRAALGIVRIILENQLHIPLGLAFNKAFLIYPSKTFKQSKQRFVKTHEEITQELLHFCMERLRVLLRSQNIRHDLIDAIFDDGTEDDICRLVSRVMHLQDFLVTEEGKKLLQSYRRVANIIEKEDGNVKGFFLNKPKKDKLIQKEEQTLHNCLETVKHDIKSLLKHHRFNDALKEIKTLQPPIDDFFEHVTVNCESPSVRKNRLLMLSDVKKTIQKIANLEKIVSE